MKVKLLSDLHLEHHSPGQYYDPGEGDVLILAGDILNVKHLKTNGYYNQIYTSFLDDCSNSFKHVLYVMGNHECYSYHLEKGTELLKTKLPNNFVLLENNTVIIENIHFTGFTLWTDFFGENPMQMWEAQNYMNDYKAIRTKEFYRKLRPYDTLEKHKQSLNFLKNQLELFKDEQFFVISHHAPSLQAIDERFKNSSCNGAFCSDLDYLILENPNIKNWVFGHVHTAFDFYIGDCRLNCNPGGYPKENTGFNSDFYLEV
jgi:predicted phosphodiesterase